MSPKQFKAIREKLGLGQAELAHLLGLSSYAPISHFETGFRTPNLLTQTIMSLLDSLPEKKAHELIEAIREHMAQVQKASKKKSNARS